MGEKRRMLVGMAAVTRSTVDASNGSAIVTALARRNSSYVAQSTGARREAVRRDRHRLPVRTY